VLTHTTGKQREEEREREERRRAPILDNLILKFS